MGLGACVVFGASVLPLSPGRLSHERPVCEMKGLGITRRPVLIRATVRWAEAKRRPCLAETAGHCPARGAERLADKSPSPRSVSRQALPPAVGPPVFSSRPWLSRRASTREIWPSSLTFTARAISRLLGLLELLSPLRRFATATRTS